jgi:hypothetical protein
MICSKCVYMAIKNRYLLESGFTTKKLTRTHFQLPPFALLPFSTLDFTKTTQLHVSRRRTHGETQFHYPVGEEFLLLC